MKYLKKFNEDSQDAFRDIKEVDTIIINCEDMLTSITDDGLDVDIFFENEGQFEIAIYKKSRWGFSGNNFILTDDNLLELMAVFNYLNSEGLFITNIEYYIDSHNSILKSNYNIETYKGLTLYSFIVILKEKL